MPRDSGRPAGYAPLLELYVRRAKEGGDVLAPGVYRPNDLERLTRRSALVLVHGFNNTDGEAAAAYLGFRAKQTARYSSPAKAFERYFADGFWPGDAAWWGLFDKADFMVYPAAVKKVPATARQLAALLLGMPLLTRVNFIAHSLGCRVVLETMELLLAANNSPSIERVCLMAPAVPADMLEPGGKYYPLMLRLNAQRTRVRVLHSLADMVLAGAFAGGQALAGEPSVRPLGRHGPTRFMPGVPFTVTHRRIGGASHGDYWGHSGKAASVTATKEAGEFLQLGKLPREIGVRRELDPPPPGIAPRATGTKRRHY